MPSSVASPSAADANTSVVTGTSTDKTERVDEVRARVERVERVRRADGEADDHADQAEEAEADQPAPGGQAAQEQPVDAP